MNINERAIQLIKDIHNGVMSSTAYDTSWFLRLRTEEGAIRFPLVKEWLLQNQHSDGSWGAKFETFHDRFISTLAVVNAFYLLDSKKFAGLIEAGLTYIRKNAQKLKDDDYETIGFELLFPMLLDEAMTFGLDIPYEEFSFVQRTRELKLSMIPNNWMYQLETPIIHNLEFLGDQLDLEKVKNLVKMNGSIGNSPSASAYVAQYIQDSELNHYLNETMKSSVDGGISNVRPFEVFEFSWVYYNLLISGIKEDEMNRGVIHLKKSWRNNGIGISQNGLMPDADDSSLTMNVLSYFDCELDIDFLDFYHSEKGYLSFPFERNPSVSTNIHILDAIRTGKTEKVKKIQQHIIEFLYNNQVDHQFWKDKWHISPYYATCHAILALRGLNEELIQSAVNWILMTQKGDGSWGVFEGTLEETAYCIQALILSNSFSDPIARSQIIKASDYLKRNFSNPHHPELWIGKGLYSPIKVIESAVLSALALFEREVNAHVKC